jgi:hypothetical protein
VYHNSGASPVQELAFSLAAWVDFVEVMVRSRLLSSGNHPKINDLDLLLGQIISLKSPKSKQPEF